MGGLRLARAAAGALGLACAACGPGFLASPFAVEVVSFSPGENAGFGQDALPDVVLGPPRGGGSGSGSLDVLSLGVGGEIVVRMGRDIVDGDGPDLLVFENAFVYGGLVFGEPGEVAVSEDGETWRVFACAPQEPPPNGCAGFAPVAANADRNDLDATVPDEAGGDAFDLADLGIDRARFVRIRDVGQGRQEAPTAGFDLDALAVVNGS